MGAIPLGSVKSNIGHLKGAAGTAGVFKTVMALHEKVLPPSINAEPANPNIDFDRVPFRVNTELRRGTFPPAGIRRAGVSAFGFGGTNFHAVLEEHVPGRRRDGGAAGVVRRRRRVHRVDHGDVGRNRRRADAAKAPLRGACVVGAPTMPRSRCGCARSPTARPRARRRRSPDPPPADLAAPVRVAIDYGNADELADKATRAAQALETGNAAMWRALRAQGVFLGRGQPGQGRVPLHRSGLAVRQHAEELARTGADRRRRRSPKPTA